VDYLLILPLIIQKKVEEHADSSPSLNQNPLFSLTFIYFPKAFDNGGGGRVFAESITNK